MGYACRKLVMRSFGRGFDPLRLHRNLNLSSLELGFFFAPFLGSQRIGTLRIADYGLLIRGFGASFGFGALGFVVLMHPTCNRSRSEHNGAFICVYHNNLRDQRSLLIIYANVSSVPLPHPI